MSIGSFSRHLYLTYLSNPASDRPIYRAIRRRHIRRILELGMGDGQRARRMIQAAAAHAPREDVRYTGIDRFEDRSAADGPGMSLKLAHRVLAATGARFQLVPGDPRAALAHTANSLLGTDLVVISARQDPVSLRAAWFYMPRLLHPGSLVLVEEALPGGGMKLHTVGPEEVQQRAAAAAARRAA